METCQPILNTGLRGFKVATTRISLVDGAAGKLVYRGYFVPDLAGKVSFEEVAYLLFYEQLPKQEELENFKKQLVSQRSIPPEVIAALKTRPKDALPMDILQASVALLAHHDPDTREYSREATLRMGIKLVAKQQRTRGSESGSGPRRQFSLYAEWNEPGRGACQLFGHLFGSSCGTFF